LTGRPPFDGSTVDKLQQHVSSPPPPLRLPGGHTSGALEGVIGRLMAKDPADRYQTPRELIASMRSLRPAHEPAVGGGPVPDRSGVSTVPDSESWRAQFEHLVTRDEPFAGVRPVQGRRAGRASSRTWLVVLAAAAFLLGGLAIVLIRLRPRR
jgi:serine/threonine-protein kinase